MKEYKEQQGNSGYKRAHRKSHGKIGFRDLAREIGKDWKKAHPTTLKLVKEYAQKERQEYLKRVEEWKEQRKVALAKSSVCMTDELERLRNEVQQLTWAVHQSSDSRMREQGGANSVHSSCSFLDG